ncbi:hypothetical protein GH975_00510 [Litorivicinus lipolyticus]|uniref:Adenylate cyclase class-I N-terminal domain-containing protein n=1 Tax=Litorivicinus lipolyticus TaxID=418701 RepID=A0A5Q2QAN7_9GAMM|nr:class I adenylate cyclase [Litorivicinus lipolyticus]QGG79116.1 hypothetical protein GH975_00510 [Litorivicinus lipolyticus]
MTAVSDVPAQLAFCESINDQRLTRALSQMRKGQRRFVRLLPTLLSINHARVPGYVSADACGGIQGFIPDKASLDSLNLRFDAVIKPAHQLARHVISSLALMGSAGSVAHGPNSDLDLWIVHRPGLNDNDRTSLKRRLAGIGLWAELSGLKLQCFLVDPEDFARQTSEPGMPKPLLLDEFYRTAIVLAGGMPAGWLIEPDQDARHATLTRALNRQLPGAKALVDFGELATPTPAQLADFAMGQLSRAINQPWKALLKLNLADYYSRHPHALLSRQTRLDLYNGMPPPDSYQALYEAISTDQPTPPWLGLMQRAFYFKTSAMLSAASPLLPPWQAMEMRALVKRWGWDGRRLRGADNTQGRDVRSLLGDYRALVDELTARFQSILLYCRGQAVMTTGHLRADVVARQLFARFEPKPGKVERINTGLAVAVHQPNLTISRAQFGWAALVDGDAVARFESLTQLVVWLHINQIIGDNTHLVIDGPDAVTEQVERLEYELLRLLHDPEPTPEAFQLPAFSDRQLYLLQAQDLRTPLGLPALAHLEVVSQNSWGEVFVTRFDGKAGFYEAFLEGLTNLLSARVGDGFDAIIRVRDQDHRIQPALDGYLRLLEDCADFFARPDYRAGTYVFRVAGAFYALAFDENEPSIVALPSMAALMHHLQQPRRLFGRVQLDPSTGITGDLLQACAMAAPGRVTYLIRFAQARATIWCIDEMGSIYRFTRPWHARASLAGQLTRFTQRSQWRQRASLVMPEPGDWDADVECIELLGQYPQVQFQPIEVTTGDAVDRLAVQAVGHWRADRTLAFEWRVGPQAFSALSHGPNLIGDVARAIRNARPSGTGYHAYISDLELPRRHEGDRNRPMQASQYLMHKHTLEAALAEALELCR